MNLTPRLLAAARLCAGAQSVIDVGCDHAHLCVELVRRGVRRAYASDIREGPLQNARVTIARCGLSDRITAVLCDGLHAFTPDMADTVVICGMGGDMIARILSEAPWALRGEHRLVLQPMTRAETLRVFLAGAGCRIEEERLAPEGERLYAVLAARGGDAPHDPPNAGLFSDAMRSDPLFDEYIARLAGRCRTAVSGRRRAGLDGGEPQRQLELLEKEIRHAP